MPQWVSRDEAMRILDISDRTLTRRITAGAFPAKRLTNGRQIVDIESAARPPVAADPTPLAAPAVSDAATLATGELVADLRRRIRRRTAVFLAICVLGGLAAVSVWFHASGLAESLGAELLEHAATRDELRKAREEVREVSTRAAVADARAQERGEECERLTDELSASREEVRELRESWARLLMKAAVASRLARGGY